MTPSQELTFLLEEKDKIIGTTFGGPSYHAIQNIIRCIDYILPFYFESNKIELKHVDYFRELIGFGWPRLLKPYYFNIDINTHLPFLIMTDELIEWTVSNLIFTGKIEICKQIISYEKAGLIKIEKKADNHFAF